MAQGKLADQNGKSAVKHKLVQVNLSEKGLIQLTVKQLSILTGFIGVTVLPTIYFLFTTYTEFSGMKTDFEAAKSNIKDLLAQVNRLQGTLDGLSRTSINQSKISKKDGNRDKFSLLKSQKVLDSVAYPDTIKTLFYDPTLCTEEVRFFCSAEDTIKTLFYDPTLCTEEVRFFSYTANAVKNQFLSGYKIVDENGIKVSFTNSKKDCIIYDIDYMIQDKIFMNLSEIEIPRRGRRKYSIR